jgi:hypothetical protein
MPQIASPAANMPGTRFNIAAVDLLSFFLAFLCPILLYGFDIRCGEDGFWQKNLLAPREQGYPARG